MPLPDYRLEAPLSSGPHGVRYRAAWEVGQVEVWALSPLANKDAAAMQRVAIARLVEHAGSQRVLAAQLDGPRPAIVLQPLFETSLLEYEDDSDEPYSLMDHLARLLEALAVAHSKGIVHGRVAPHSIWNSKDGWKLNLLGLDCRSGGATVWPDEILSETPPDDVARCARILREMLDSRARTLDPDVDRAEAELREQVDSWIARATDEDDLLRPSALESARELRAIIERARPDLMTMDRTTDSGLADAAATAPPFQSRPRSEVPEELGRFQVLSKLGEGGMGSVYKGRDRSDGSIVAVKLLNAATAGNENARRRFIKEARLLAKLDSPFVARLVEFNNDENGHFLVQEFVPGKPVDEFLQEHGALEERRALQLIRDVARALTAAHRHGIIHRDVKPANVLYCGEHLPDDETTELAADGEPPPCAKLTDFGLARMQGQSESLAVTNPGALVGTPYYMSPEQCRGEQADARADIYAIGVMLYEMLAGERPFDAETPMAVLAKHLNEEPTPLKSRQQELSDAVCGVVERAMAKAPEARFSEASEFLSEVEQILRGAPTTIRLHPQLPSDGEGVLSYQFEWRLKSSASAMWPFVANTDRLNRAMGLPAATFRIEHGPERSRRLAETRIGGMKIAWEEFPFEWIEARRMGVFRDFSTGVFDWFSSTVDLLPQSDGGVLLTHGVRIKPRGLMGRFVAQMEIGIKAKRSLERIYKKIDDYIQEGRQADPKADPFAPTKSLSRKRKQRLEQRIERLSDLNLDPLAVDALTGFLEHAPDQDAARIRPIEFADRFGLDRDETLKCMLHAAREGLLLLMWDILCPTCRIPADVQSTLKAVQQHGYCEACEIEYELDFGRSVEMIFRAHPDVRDVEVRTYCVGGPAFSPHVISQTRVAPGERFVIDVHLDDGEYEICGPQLPHRWRLSVRPSGDTTRWEAALAQPPRGDAPMVLKSGNQVITLANDSSQELLVRLERASIRDAVTAADASAMALFREFFPQQVLSPGETVSVARMTLLQAVWPGAMDLYQRLGESQAFAILHQALRDADQKTKEQGGAIVRTSDDGFTAVFSSARDALIVALALQPLEDPESDSRLLPAIAAHLGPAMVATFNDRLDYFGATVRLSRQLGELARPGQLLVTHSIQSREEARELLSESSLVASPLDEILEESPDQRLYEIWLPCAN